MLHDISANGFPARTALAEVQKPALSWLSRFVAFVQANGMLTPEERQAYHSGVRRLGLEPGKVGELTSTIEREFALSEVRAGRMRTIRRPDVHLPFEENCYYAEQVTRWKPARNGMYSVAGQLLLTSKSITFSAVQLGGQVLWKKVTQVRQAGPQQVSIEATVATLAGTFAVLDPQWFVEIGLALIRFDRRIIVDTGNAGRMAIPRHVKAEVWHRNRGACRQCGMDGSGGASLGFDHIIPVALGGATPTENLQVLCRRRNGLKGART